MLAVVNDQPCYARVSAIRKMHQKNLTGQLVIAEQIVALGGGLETGFVKAVVDGEQVQYPYVRRWRILQFDVNTYI